MSTRHETGQYPDEEGNRPPPAVADAIDGAADAIATGAAPPALPPVPGESPRHGRAA